MASDKLTHMKGTSTKAPASVCWISLRAMMSPSIRGPKMKGTYANWIAALAELKSAVERRRRQASLSLELLHPAFVTKLL